MEPPIKLKFKSITSKFDSVPSCVGRTPEITPFSSSRFWRSDSSWSSVQSEPERPFRSACIYKRRVMSLQFSLCLMNDSHITLTNINTPHGTRCSTNHTTPHAFATRSQPCIGSRARNGFNLTSCIRRCDIHFTREIIRCITHEPPIPTSRVIKDRKTITLLESGIIGTYSSSVQVGDPIQGKILWRSRSIQVPWI